MWPKHWTQYIRRLDEGNERIIGIEVKGSPNSIFIINVYMPTKETISQSNFNKHLDILHDMVVRYNRLGAVIVCGDMNGTLIEERNNSHHCLSSKPEIGVFLFTDNNRQQPTTTDNNRQQPTTTVNNRQQTYKYRQQVFFTK